MRLILIVLVAWVIGLGSYLLYDRYWPGHTGSVYVTSTPTGGEIWMDLAPVGKTTPAEISEIPIGKHSFTVRLGGQRATPFVQIAEVMRGSSDTLSFTLQDDGSSGYRDQRIGSVTPPARIPPVEEAISEKVRKQEPWDVPRQAPRSVDSLTMMRGGDGEPTVSQIPEDAPPPETMRDVQRAAFDTVSGRESAATGAVEVSSSIPGATIILNDRRLEQKTPTVLSLPLGTHTIRVELPGYSSEPEQHAVRLSRVAGGQLVFFTLTEEQRAHKEFTITTEPVEGAIFVNGDSVGFGLAVVPHDFGVFSISYGDVEGYIAPEPSRLAVTPAKPNPTVTATYMRKMRIAAECGNDGQVDVSGDLRWEIGIYDRDKGARQSDTHGPKVNEIPGVTRMAWELGMGDPNRNPTGSDYIKFIFTLPPDVSPASPLNLRLYMYRSNRKYPLSLSSRCEVTVTVNGRVFLDNYRPRHDQTGADSERFEEWSLQHTLVPGENRIMIRTGEKNQLFNYLWKFEVL
ncbi:MAG: PEGA domain-containing protein [bacterium]|nr:PEGA domain-containing protein [bacterium]